MIILVSFVEGFWEISELTKLDLVSNAMQDAAKGWFIFRRQYIRNVFVFCEEFMAKILRWWSVLFRQGFWLSFTPFRNYISNSSTSRIYIKTKKVYICPKVRNISRTLHIRYLYSSYRRKSLRTIPNQQQKEHYNDGKAFAIGAETLFRIVVWLLLLCINCYRKQSNGHWPNKNIMPL